MVDLWSSLLLSSDHCMEEWGRSVKGSGMAVRVNVAEDDAASSDDHVRFDDGRVLAAPRGVGEGMIKRLEAVACMCIMVGTHTLRCFVVHQALHGSEEGNFWSEQVGGWVVIVRSSKIELVGVLTHV